MFRRQWNLYGSGPYASVGIAHLRSTDDDILRVSLANKVHNARAILRDLRSGDVGKKVWDGGIQ